MRDNRYIEEKKMIASRIIVALSTRCSTFLFLHLLTLSKQLHRYSTTPSCNCYQIEQATSMLNLDRIATLFKQRQTEVMLHVDPNIVVFIRIRFPIFFLLCLYQIFYFGVIHLLHFSSSFSYNMQTPFFSHVTFMLYSFMFQILFLFSYISRASFIHELHVVSLFIYQPGFIHSCVVFCLFFHISARLHLFIHCILPLIVYISDDT